MSGIGGKHTPPYENILVEIIRVVMARPPVTQIRGDCCCCDNVPWVRMRRSTFDFRQRISWSAFRVV
jgi:hypothetical protein